MTFVYILFVLGIVFVIKGGDIFTDGAIWLAKYTGIPQVIIGATIVSIATTMPEFIVALIAALTGHPDMAVGNVVGSATVNLGLVLGLSIIIAPAVVSKAFKSGSAIMLVTGIIFVFMLNNGTITRINALLLLVLLVAYLAVNFRQAVIAKKVMEKPPASSDVIVGAEKKSFPITNVIKFVVGAVLIIIGSRLLIDNGSQIASFFGVPELIIALTLIALGTSLPELVTAVTSALKGNPALGIGNVFGANFFNLTMVFGGTAIIAPIPVSEQTLLLDAPVMLILMMLTFFFTYKFKKLTRTHGFAILAVYLVYFVNLAVKAI